jgi:outer membrane lipoprotein SlyB
LIGGAQESAPPRLVLPINNNVFHRENIIKTYQKCLIGLFALLPLLSLGLMTTKANAQQYNSNSVTPRIHGFNVDEVSHLTAGTELNFSIYGTPGATATLRIDGAQRNLILSESEAGQYEGIYTISTRDRITAESAVTANLRLGNLVVSNVLSESLQAGTGYRSPEQTNRVAAAYPKITRFDVEPSTELDRGNHLAFTLYGTPDGKAEVAISGAKGRFFLYEGKSGEYSGIYRIKPRDRIASNSVVTANLRVGNQMTSATLGKALLTAAVPVAKICANCGAVEAVNIIEVKGDGNYLGTIGGGLIGGLLGNQVGGGSGKKVATVAGVIGGALAGRAIESNVKKTVHYEILVRLENGGTQMITFDADPGLKIGDKVKINDGVLSRNI